MPIVQLDGSINIEKLLDLSYITNYLATDRYPSLSGYGDAMQEAHSMMN